VLRLLVDRSRSIDRERGAVMVAFVILLVVVIGIAGLVVDIGFGSQKRRQVQNAADAAVLAAAQSLPSTTGSVSTAQGYASTNLPGGNFAWSTCSDANHLAVVSAVSQCISFDSSFTQVRVKMPRQTLSTGLAKVLGFNSLSTGAIAQARVVGAGMGSVLPFGLYSGFSSGLTCLKTASGGLSQAPCTDPVTGNFNLLDITQYGNTTLKSPTRCGNSFQADRMVDNIAIGVDHVLAIWQGPNDIVDACGVPGPDTVPPRTGNDQSAFDTGMLHARTGTNDTSDSGPGRLARTAYPKATAAGVAIDNKPLWEFVPTGLPTTGPDAVPTSCRRETFDATLAGTPTAQQQLAMQAALQTCFTDYADGNYSGAVFSANTNPFGKEVPVDLYDIQLSGRFAYVPQFAESGPPNGNSGDLRIASFRPIYIQELYAGCNSNSCSVQFEPGPWNTGSLGNTNDQARAITGWVFDPTMLPLKLRNGPTVVGQNNYVQLTK
jgi:hypothetical protein